MENKGINFFIHDLHPFGGQDRSTLEILNELSERMPVHVYAYTLRNPAYPQSRIQFHRCPVGLARPVLFKSVIFHMWSLWVRFTTPRRLTFSTGTCSLFTDIVHVQFVANAWKKEKRKMLVQRKGIRRLYHHVLAAYNTHLEKKLFSKSRSFAAISHSVAKDLRSHFGVNAIDVIHHGVDVDKFRPAASPAEKAQLREELQLPATAPLFLFVGAYDRKGLATLVLATKKLREKFPDACVVAVGEGEREKYLELGEDADAPTWTLLRSPSKEIEKYFRACDAFVLPTLYEPFGLVILEAMSCGLPVITTKVAGASELIAHGKTGLLLDDANDVNALKNLMAEMLGKPELRLHFASEARNVALQRSWKEVASDFESLITKEKTRKGLA